jgi:hypothetical protein
VDDKIAEWGQRLSDVFQRHHRERDGYVVHVRSLCTFRTQSAASWRTESVRNKSRGKTLGGGGGVGWNWIRMLSNANLNSNNSNSDIHLIWVIAICKYRFSLTDKILEEQNFCYTYNYIYGYDITHLDKSSIKNVL